MPDRETFFKEFSSTLDFLLMQPESPAQKYVTIVLASVLAIFLLSLFHRWGKAARTGFWLSLLACAVSIFFMLVAGVWANKGIARWDLVEGQKMAALAILLGVAFFAGVAPWTRFCFKAAYFTSVAAWILTFCFVGGAVYFSMPVWKTMANTGTNLEKAAESANRTTESANR